MLRSLKKLLDNYSEEKGLNEIKDTCCSDVGIKVLDFDAITKKFCDNLKIPLLHSMDALYLVCEKNVLYLMEMKRHSNTVSCKDFIYQHFYSDISEGDMIIRKNNGECTTKIIDTLYILLCIIGCSSLNEDFYKYFMNPTRLKIVTLLITDFNDEEYIGLVMASLDKLDISITKMFIGQIEIINCSSLPKLLLN